MNAFLENFEYNKQDYVGVYAEIKKVLAKPWDDYSRLPFPLRDP